MKKSFPAKILLFGEYTVIHGGGALAIPFDRFRGMWEQGNIPTSEFALPFAKHLEELNRNTIGVVFDTEKFLAEADEGIFFHSNIPEGYGVGSSGAYVAAVFDRYGTTHFNPEDYIFLKKVFAAMEGFFHGSSSGMDPLVCYLNKCLLFENESVKAVELPEKWEKRPVFFLLDTLQKRSTGPFIKQFMEDSKKENYRQLLLSGLIPASTAAIRAVSTADNNLLTDSIKKISQFQLEYFKAMIPDFLIPSWKEGLKTERYLLKLCGGGGGGFMLGLATDESVFENELKEHKVIPFHVII